MIKFAASLTLALLSHSAFASQKTLSCTFMEGSNPSYIREVVLNDTTDVKLGRIGGFLRTFIKARLRIPFCSS